MNNQKFFDGCHRFGWLINVCITLLSMLAMFAAVNGKMDGTLQQIDKRVSQLEATIVQVLLKGATK